MLSRVKLFSIVFVASVQFAAGNAADAQETYVSTVTFRYETSAETGAAVISVLPYDAPTLNSVKAKTPVESSAKTKSRNKVVVVEPKTKGKAKKNPPAAAKKPVAKKVVKVQAPKVAVPVANPEPIQREQASIEQPLQTPPIAAAYTEPTTVYYYSQPQVMPCTSGG